MHDVKSNLKLIEHIPAGSQSAGTVNGEPLDLQGFTNASFFISCGTVGANGTVQAKIQHSDNGSKWTDSKLVDTGDTVSIPNQSAAFAERLHVTKPTHRYYRVVLTIGTATSVVGVMAVVGGARHKPISY
ncbi:hypothetical protein [Thermoactinomyces sp. DSM 45892]|uniref:hypothetical protein n=1 Tax=Thermoactinomyces sp. DSM 45892 TaxID=1882753 RepID=UPI0008972245|nr:hypothetical protein [Thermoactinomyces sp. DSM 45892]SDY23016.1 hypothetical protein SAMN05444416_10340 [Thermoactinomyces sp. DSM 45892]